MDMDIGGRTSPFEFVEPVCLYTTVGETPSTVCNIDRRLSYLEVSELLTNTSEEQCTRWPPSKPKSGDVFIFTYQDEKHHFDFVADGMNWRNQGTRLYSKDGIVTKKRYYQRRIGRDAVDFKKCVYEISSLTRVLIHYLGSRDEELAEAPHGNRRKHLDKGHIRVMPSVLADIKESKDNVGDIYMKMVAECRVPAENFKVAMPRNMKQVENRKQYEKKQEHVEKCDVGEILNLLQLNTELSGFVKYLSMIPTLNAVLINEQLLQELAEIVNTCERCIISCITNIKVRDFYISSVIARHHQFEGEPGLPIAWLIHHRTSAASYKMLFKVIKELAPIINTENVVLVAGKEKEIHEAWRELMGNTHQFICWESLKKSAFYHLKKQKITGPHKKSCLEDVTALLLSKHDEDYDQQYEEFKQGWSPEFTVAFDTQLYLEIKSSIHGKLLLQDVYTQDIGITVVESDGLNTVMHALSLWVEAGLDGITLALYMLGSYYQCQMSQSFSNTGHWKLKPENGALFREPEDLHLPSGAAEPAEIIKIVQCKLDGH